MRKMYRSRSDSKLTGLCGGLAEMLNVDPTLLRLIVVATAIFSGGAPVIFLYIIASIVIPKEPQFGGPGMFQPPTFGGTYGSTPPPMYGPSGQQPPAGGYGFGRPDVRPPQPQQAQASQPVQPQPAASNDLDEMMKDIEQKAMRKELEELRAKLAKFEKGE